MGYRTPNIDRIAQEGMHFRTHPKPKSVGQSGKWQSVYHDVMIDHDKND